ncbi:recombinase family protein [Vagococcus salmoninarum]|uniref:Resolvase n=1 Tax=Vagococcus salmoninarum TaxID=2739 RepID=A0A429ZW56_9ENTE|nr:recombinase family protein [Vagococcus salmoninarum]RST97962.1 resolvase [Vagococcus salmoninarum]
MKTIGYARISTTYQKFDSQKSKLKKYGCDKIYTETQSGKINQRETLDKALASLEPGDTFVVYKLDRLSRGTKYLLELMETFKQRDIRFVSLSDNINTTTPMGVFFFTIMGAFAEMEPSLIRERVIAGLSATREKGTVLGRPVKTDQKEKVAKLYNEGLTPVEIINLVEVSKPTVYRYIKELKQETS